MAYSLGTTYLFYCGLAAAAPTTPADETSDAYNSCGEIPGEITITRSRNSTVRRTRDDPNAQYVHMGDRSEGVSFQMNLDLADNAVYQDLQAAYNSDADGVGAAGTLLYFNITDAVAGNLQWYGIAGVTDLGVAIPRADGLVSVNVSLVTNGDLTETTHA